MCLQCSHCQATAKEGRTPVLLDMTHAHMPPLAGTGALIPASLARDLLRQGTVMATDRSRSLGKRPPRSTHARCLAIRCCIGAAHSHRTLASSPHAELPPPLKGGQYRTALQLLMRDLPALTSLELSIASETGTVIDNYRLVVSPEAFLALRILQFSCFLIPWEPSAYAKLTRIDLCGCTVSRIGGLYSFEQLMDGARRVSEPRSPRSLAVARRDRHRYPSPKTRAVPARPLPEIAQACHLGPGHERRTLHVIRTPCGDVQPPDRYPRALQRLPLPPARRSDGAADAPLLHQGRAYVLRGERQDVRLQPHEEHHIEVMCTGTGTRTSVAPSPNFPSSSPAHRSRSSALRETWGTSQARPHGWPHCRRSQS
ncbi:hypothetical protein C8Q80DRAFT_143147 [Daedaleopsis nitida]|nr:hypothetical protein C8Q80DRAFT_143147 [Daedaleopsis nitida]